VSGDDVLRVFTNSTLKKVARVTGLEPATSGVTGRHSNQLSYTRAYRGIVKRLNVALNYGHKWVKSSRLDVISKKLAAAYALRGSISDLWCQTWSEHHRNFQRFAIFAAINATKFKCISLAGFRS
jgi:hypothetical protein